MLRQGTSLVTLDAFHCPEVTQNILSAQDILRQGFTVTAQGDTTTITLGDVSFIMNGQHLRCDDSCPQSTVVLATTEESAELWHRRLGHPSAKSAQQLGKHAIGLPERLPATIPKCTTCIVGKSHRAPCLRADGKKTAHPGDLAHIDTARYPVLDLDGNRYAVFIEDDFSRWTAVFPVKRKSDACRCLLAFHREIPIKTIRSDNAGDLHKGQTKRTCEELGIQMQSTDPYTPQMNRIEAKIRTIHADARTLLLSQELPPAFWADALSTAAYLANRRLTRAPEQHVTPYELRHSKKPALDHLRVFGCQCYIHVPSKARENKLSPTAHLCIFLGYSKDNDFQYILYCPDSRRRLKSKSVTFLEDRIGGRLLPPDHPTRSEYLVLDDAPDIITATDNDDDDNEAIDCSALHLSTNHDISSTPPKSFKDAMRLDPDGWGDAMMTEMDSLRSMDVFQIVPFKPGRHLIDAMWVFANKCDASGNFVRKKARLVARGFSQKPGVDFTDTFAPTGTATLLRVVIALALRFGLQLHYLDVKTAYLNADLEEEVYVRPPPGTDTPPGHVWRLNKSLYGLRQSGRNWYLLADDVIRALGFQPTTTEPCMYASTPTSPVTNNAYLLLNTDDLLIAATNDDMATIVGHFEAHWSVQHGTLTDYIGVHVNQQDDSTVHLSQPRNIHKALAEHGLDNCRPSRTPTDKRPPPLEGVEGDAVAYQQVVGSLGHVARYTRPDIAYAFGFLSRAATHPDKTHEQMAKRVLRYLAAAQDRGLTIRRSTLTLSCYSDADWAGDETTRASTSGVLVLLGSNPIYWNSVRQRVVAKSSAEAEYAALNTAAGAVMYLRGIFSDLGIPQELPTVIYTDSQSAIAIAKADTVPKRSKHIEVRYHYIRSLIQRGLIQLRYVRSADNVADFFTKGLTKDVFEKHRDAIMNAFVEPLHSTA